MSNQDESNKNEDLTPADDYPRSSKHYEKMRAIAEFLEGSPKDDRGRVEICLKGSVLGFPATIEALRAGFPFGVTYIVETNVTGQKSVDKHSMDESLHLQILPRYAKGIMAFVARLLLFEAKGQTTGNKKFDNRYICSYNNTRQAESFLSYPGVIERIERLDGIAKFNEIGIRVGAGIYLGQPTSFSSLELGTCKETFKLLAEIAQILFESFDSSS